VRLATVALEACILLLVVGAVAAQDRMPPIPKEKMTEAQKKSFEEVTSGPRAGGGAEGPFVPLLRSPELMSRLQKTGEYLRFHNTIGPKLTEFVILLTARQWTQQYEYDVHQVNGAKAGIKQETINAITEGRDLCARRQQVWRARRDRHDGARGVLHDAGHDHERRPVALAGRKKGSAGFVPTLRLF
jgi:hypothetical protein